MPLKTSITGVVLSFCGQYNSLLLTKRHKSRLKSDYQVNLHGKFDVDNFDGVYLVSSLSVDGKDLSIGSVEFKVYLVSTDNSWSETLIDTLSGSISNNKATAFLPSASIDPIYLDGSLTISVEAVITRQSDVFKKKVFLNHLGIYESFFRLKQDVDFLDITKKDE